jgi:hypothetical protein
MMITHDIRSQRLIDLSKMVINDTITHKLDHLATIYINKNFYFSVYRRYNSPYNIVIEDKNSDIYLHQDHTIRTSLKTVLCLDDYLTSKIYTLDATSYKHSGPVPSMDKDVADMRWTELQGNYHAAVINFGSIFYDDLMMNDYWENAPSTPVAQMIPPILTPPAAPARPNMNDTNVANILLTLNIPVQDNTFKMSESDEPTLSMRFADIKKRLQDYEMDSSDDEYEDEDDDSNYMVLRNGTMIPKLH